MASTTTQPAISQILACIKTTDECPSRTVDSPQHANGTDDEAWRTIRTPNPVGGPEAISIARTADLSRSDPGFVGLMFRCSDVGIEGLAVLVAPLPPQSHPRVYIGTGDDQIQFAGRMVPPFSTVLLSAEATALITSAWQTREELHILVDDGGNKVGGVVSLAGLGVALPRLGAQCRSRQMP